MQDTIAIIKRDFKIVYTCNKRHFWGFYKRTFISANNLQKWIGADNADTAFLRAQNSAEDKVTVRFRKFGRVEFYVK